MFEFIARLYFAVFQSINVVAQNIEVQMNIVEPIKSIEYIQNIKQILSKKPRNALLFSFGINSGLRIAGILSLDVKDVKGKDYIQAIKDGYDKVQY